MRIILFLSFVLASYAISNNQILAAGDTCKGPTKYGAASDYVLNPGKNEIKIMSYNVENLFDAVHDDGRDDYEFLPKAAPEKENCSFENGYYKTLCYKTDWTDDKFRLHLDQTKKVLEAQGELPDVLIVAEVENVNVVSQLADTLGYPKFLVTSGSDKRIEAAILYKEDKLKLKEMKELVIEFPKGLRIKTTRNILVANFSVKGQADKILGVYANHWPSQGSPSGARVVAAKFLKQGIEANAKKYGKDNYYAIAGGDFNTIDSDDPHPFEQLVDAVQDVETIYRKSAYKKDTNKMYENMPEGTYYYPTDKSWNHLDHFFVTPNLVKDGGMRAQIENFRIIAAPFMLKNKFTFKDNCVNGIPAKYNVDTSAASGAGYSDHFPIEMTVDLN
jgi:predicted extracellular nuclease